MKRILSLLLCITMVLPLSACGSKTETAAKTETKTEAASEQQEGQGGNTSGIDFGEEPYTISVCYAVGSEAQPDLGVIEEKLNEITLKEINAKVKLEVVSLYSMANVYALKASSQEKMDLMVLFPGSKYLASFANSNAIMPIEEYVGQWGKEMTEIIGDKMKVGEYKDHQYAIPQTTGVSKNGYGFYLSRELCAKYDIDPASIATIEDLEAAFALVKENEPGVTILMPEMSSSSIGAALVSYTDSCGAGEGVLEVKDDGSLGVINYKGTEEYMAISEKVREWYEKGYISKDVLTSQDHGADVLKTGKCFAVSTSSIDPAMGDDVKVAVILNHEKPLLATSDEQLIMYAVSSNSERPEKAIQFLNLCFESEEIANLIRFGVEGVHYNVLENGAIDTANNAAYINPWNLLGDYDKLYVELKSLESMVGVETVEQYKEKMDAWEVEVSPAYGFNFDPTNVKTEIAACDEINNKYNLAISNGTVDPKTEIPKWNQELENAGLQKVMDEKLTQLNEWYSKQNK